MIARNYSKFVRFLLFAFSFFSFLFYLHELCVTVVINSKQILNLKLIIRRKRSYDFSRFWDRRRGRRDSFFSFFKESRKQSIHQTKNMRINREILQIFYDAIRLQHPRQAGRPHCANVVAHKPRYSAAWRISSYSYVNIFPCLAHLQPDWPRYRHRCAIHVIRMYFDTMHDRILN